jgi:hypothetical protein
MKKAIKFTYLLALWVLGLCLFGMFYTYFNQYLSTTGFFGDWIDDTLWDKHQWGVRHYWYFWMCTLLFILSIIRCIIWCWHYWDLSNKI